MPKFIDLTGKRFTHLLVLYRVVRNESRQTFWKCICDCGNESIVNSIELRREGTKSCGCKKNELISNGLTRHGFSKSRINNIYHDMMNRCNNPNNTAFINYGGRGITVCERWNEFENFLIDMGGSYFNGATIERIEVNGNYEPSNCKWATKLEQARNTRRNVRYNYKGQMKLLSEISENIGIKQATLRWRIEIAKWTLNDAFTKPVLPPMQRHLVRFMKHDINTARG